MASIDETVGHNVARLRGEMSQKELADAMRARGFKWSQATVWSIEKGERPLRLSEAEALQWILHFISPSELLREEKSARMNELMRQVQSLSERFEAATEDYTMALWQLAEAADEVDAPLSGFDAMAVRSWTTESTPLRLLKSRHAEALEATKETGGLPYSSSREAGPYEQAFLDVMNSDG